MNQNTVSGDIIAFNLKQLGATDIKVFDSRMHIANFDLGNGFLTFSILQERINFSFSV